MPGSPLPLLPPLNVASAVAPAARPSAAFAGRMNAAAGVAIFGPAPTPDGCRDAGRRSAAEPNHHRRSRDLAFC
jgi:hypothetical protein